MNKPTEPKQSNPARRSLLVLCLLVLVAGVALAPRLLTAVSAAIQKAARRTSAPAPKRPKSAQAVAALRQAQATQFISQSQPNPDGTLTPGKLITAPPVQRTTFELMIAVSNGGTLSGFPHSK